MPVDPMAMAVALKRTALLPTVVESLSAVGLAAGSAVVALSLVVLLEAAVAAGKKAEKED